MAAGLLLNVALSETRHTFVAADFCQRVRFKKSRCQRCLEVCPQDAISLDPGPILNSRCTDCGLCHNACPSEVFQHEIYTDAYVLNQVKTHHDRDGHFPPEERKTLWVHCRRAEKQNENGVALTCLGRITANIILGMALLGFDEVVLIKGVCSQCRLHAGEKLLAKAMMTSRILLESTGRDRFAIRIMEKETQKEALVSRREIFSKLSHTVKNKALSVVSHKTILEKLTGQRASARGKRLSPQRQLLAKLLNHQGFDQTRMVEYKPEFPWGKIKIEEKKCAACGICVALCPTGAITKKLKNERLLLCFHISRCNNCALCKAACPQNAIEFEGHFSFSEIVEDSAGLAAAIKLTSCRICGEMTTIAESRICPTCRKRQVAPNCIRV